MWLACGPQDDVKCWLGMRRVVLIPGDSTHIRRSEDAKRFTVAAGSWRNSCLHAA